MEIRELSAQDEFSLGRKIQYLRNVDLLMQQAYVPSITISNQLERTAVSFAKFTEVRLGNHLLRIRDDYTLLRELAEAESTHEASEHGKEIQGTFHKDKKNVVKNIVKAFRAWTFGMSASRPEFQNSTCQIDQLLAKSKFNNKMILELSASPLNQCFSQFLEHHAEQWISESKINDKKSHLEAVKTYLQICQQKDAFAKFRVFRRRVKCQ